MEPVKANDVDVYFCSIRKETVPKDTRRDQETAAFVGC